MKCLQASSRDGNNSRNPLGRRPELMEGSDGDYYRNHRRRTTKLLTSPDTGCREIQQLPTGRVSTINNFLAVTAVTLGRDGSQ